jgi:drug/metabolite transporter (DMT)-like permease
MMMIALLIFSFGWVVIKIGLQELSPITFATIRFFIASILMFMFLGATKQLSALRNISKKQWGIFFIMGSVGIFLSYAFTFTALTLITASESAIIINLDAVFIAILSIIFLKERFTIFKFIGFFVAFLGVIVVVSEGIFIYGTLTSARFLGELLILASAVCWSVFSILGKTATNRFSPILVTGMSFAIGTPLLAALSFVTEDVGILISASAVSWAAILYLGLGNSIATLLFFKCLQRTEEVSRVSVFFLLLPVFVPILAFFTIGEIITYFTIVGAILVILGVYLVEHK